MHGCVEGKAEWRAVIESLGRVGMAEADSQEIDHCLYGRDFQSEGS